MLSAVSSKRAVRRSAFTLVAPLGLMVLASALVVSHRLDARRGKAAVHAVSPAALTVAPMILADFTASPGVTTPTAAVARFSILKLPLTAYVATVSHTRMITIARVGSLHGP
ncbi:MAG: hypothetical protein PVI86_00930 [Phycisphaerae bacterium]|jgi:hypothetical protein